jgi:cellobiose-specific phosphotransferase system component IIC
MNKHLRSIHDSLPQWIADWFDVLVPAVEVALIVLCALMVMRISNRLIGKLSRTYLLPKKVASLSQRVVGFVVYGGALLWSLERMGVSGAVLWSAFTGFAAVGAIK